MSSSTSKKGESNFCLACFQDADFDSRYIFTLEGKDMKISASDPQPVRIPARARHTFKVDDTYEGPCSIEISTAISPKSRLDDPEVNRASEKLYVNDSWRMVSYGS